MMRTATLLAAAALMLGIGGWRNGTARGTVAAIIDNARGRPAFYALGGTSEWPREPRDFRVYEILARDYHMSFITNTSPRTFAAPPKRVAWVEITSRDSS